MDDEKDPQNKIRGGLYVDDERTTVFDTDEDGNRVIHRYFGGEWHEYHPGADDAAEEEAE